MQRKKSCFLVETSFAFEFLRDLLLKVSRVYKSALNRRNYMIIFYDDYIIFKDVVLCLVVCLYKWNDLL